MGFSVFIDLGLSGWQHEPERAENRPLGAHVRQLAARVNALATTCQWQTAGIIHSPTALAVGWPTLDKSGYGKCL